MNQIEKIKFVIKNNAEGNKNKFAKMVGVSTQAVSKWVNEIASPSRQTVKQIAKIAGVNESWFFDDRQDESTINNEFVSFYLAGATFSCGDGAVIEQDFSGNIRSFEMGKALAKSICNETEFSNIRIANAKGDSMAPTISPGDLLFLDVSVTTFRGDGLYAFCYEGHSYVKRLQLAGDRIIVISDNKTYESWSISIAMAESLFIIAKVISCLPMNMIKFS